MRCGGQTCPTQPINLPTCLPALVTYDEEFSVLCLFIDDLVIRKVEGPDEGLGLGGAWLEDALEWLGTPIRSK